MPRRRERRSVNSRISIRLKVDETSAEKWELGGFDEKIVPSNFMALRAKEASQKIATTFLCFLAAT